jgi:hypothetical protein
MANLIPRCPLGVAYSGSLFVPRHVVRTDYGRLQLGTLTLPDPPRSDSSAYPAVTLSHSPLIDPPANIDYLIKINLACNPVLRHSQHIQNVLCSNAACGTRRVWTSAETTHGRIYRASPTLECSQDIRDGRATCVVGQVRVVSTRLEKIQ